MAPPGKRLPDPDAATTAPRAAAAVPTRSTAAAITLRRHARTAAAATSRRAPAAPLVDPPPSAAADPPRPPAAPPVDPPGAAPTSADPPRPRPPPAARPVDPPCAAADPPRPRPTPAAPPIDPPDAAADPPRLSLKFTKKVVCADLNQNRLALAVSAHEFVFTSDQRKSLVNVSSEVRLEFSDSWSGTFPVTLYMKGNNTAYVQRTSDMFKKYSIKVNDELDFFSLPDDMKVFKVQIRPAAPPNGPQMAPRPTRTASRRGAAPQMGAPSPDSHYDAPTWMRRPTRAAAPSVSPVSPDEVTAASQARTPRSRQGAAVSPAAAPRPRVATRTTTPGAPGFAPTGPRGRTATPGAAREPLPTPMPRGAANRTTTTHLQRGALIVIEGVDCSVHSQMLVSFLEGEGRSVEKFSFPDTSTVIGGAVAFHELCKVDDELELDFKLDDESEHLLNSLNRREKRYKMERLLETGTTLVVDGYSYGGVATSAADGLDFEWCKLTEVGLPAADVVFYLDISPKEAAVAWGGRYQTELKFQTKLQDNFKALRNGKWKVLDRSLSLSDIATAIQEMSLNVIEQCKLGKCPLIRLWED